MRSAWTPSFCSGRSLIDIWLLEFSRGDSFATRSEHSNLEHVIELGNVLLDVGAGPVDLIAFKRRSTNGVSVLRSAFGFHIIDAIVVLFWADAFWYWHYASVNGLAPGKSVKIPRAQTLDTGQLG